MPEKREDGKVMVELEMPKGQVSIHPADDGDEDGKKLEKTQAELRQTKKEVEDLKKKVEEAEKNDNKENGESTLKQTTGYELNEIVGAPLSPPEPKAKGRPKLSQLRLILVGFLVVFTGVVLWPVFTFSVGLSVIIVGAILVAIGVLARL